MNRLWVRLSLAFVAVTLLAVSIVAVLADWNASTQFRQYLARQDVIAQSGVLDDLVAYYQQRGTWDGVESVLASAFGRGRGQPRGSRPTLLVTDANYRVVYDEGGTRVGRDDPSGRLYDDERSIAQPIVASGRTVGYWLVSRAGQGLSSSEQNFLNQLRVAFIVAAIAAGGIGVVLGLLTSRALAAPLANLARAARAFASRDWNRRVPVRGADEIAEVAREFNEMADALQHAETLRRNLMADIAHELRTPLTVLQGNLRAMLDDVYPLERSEIATLYDETRLLNRLVDDLRELALAESGQLQLNSQSTDVSAIVRAAAANFAAAADAQNVRLGVEASDDLLCVDADPDRLAQVLRNLLSNALRYTPSGGVVSVQYSVNSNQYSVNSEQFVRVCVCDTGEGIAPEDLSHVFDRFYRGDKSRTRTSFDPSAKLRAGYRSGGGTGLGLAIAKTLIEAMGGAIGVESTRGGGSRFWFTLPKSKIINRKS